jgi:hypothetical protein
MMCAICNNEAGPDAVDGLCSVCLEEAEQFEEEEDCDFDDDFEEDAPEVL